MQLATEVGVRRADIAAASLAILRRGEACPLQPGCPSGAAARNDA